MRSKKVLIFDASSLISITMNGLLEELRKLKEIFNGYFVITKEVQGEIVKRPLKIKRYELEAMKIQQFINEGILHRPDILKIKDNKITKLAHKYIILANEMYVGKGQKIKLIHDGEASCLGLSKILEQKNIKHGIVLDERTLRMLIEKPENLKSLLEKRTHAQVKLKKSNFKQFKGFKIIRSSELMYVAWKKGLIRWKHKELLDGLLYALKYKGCAISDEEIEKIKKFK